MSHTDSPWLPEMSRRPDASVRLFCFPYAGAGPQIYRAWADEIPDWIEVWPVQLPGHGARLRERPHHELAPLIAELAAALAPHLGKSFAFQGHSLGALLAYETLHALRGRGLAPLHLFVSGLIAPHRPNPNPPIHHLPQAQFVEELRRLGGTPHAVIDCPELMALMLPGLRGDFTLLETYPRPAREKLDCPISVLGGDRDPRTNRPGLEAWSELTKGSFALTIMPGDHFFIDPCRQAILRAIAGRLHADVFRCTQTQPDG